VPVLTVVEGDSDLGFAQAAINAAGAVPGTPVVQHGHGQLDARLRSHWNRGSNATEMLVLRDLDPTPGSTRCAVDAAASLIRPRQHAPSLCLRLAVREIESRAMADVDAFSAFFAVPSRRLPHNPDALPDPKATLVALCGRSRRREIRDGIAPRPASGRTSVRNTSRSSRAVPARGTPSRPRSGLTVFGAPSMRSARMSSTDAGAPDSLPLGWRGMKDA